MFCESGSPKPEKPRRENPVANSTLLQLVQQATAELGVPIPATVVGNTNQDVTQILALMNASGYELLRKADWRQLTKTYTFFTSFVTTTGTIASGSQVITGIPSTAALDTTFMVVGGGFPNATFIQSVDSGTQITADQKATVTGSNQTIYFQKAKYALPTDYDAIVSRTQWDKSAHWEMIGPEDAQQWEWLMSGYISTGPRVRWRLLGQFFQIWPGFSNAENLGFEYRAKSWALSTGGTAQNSFLADTDTCIYPDRLMVLSCKLKYFEAKGFPTQAMFMDYTTELETDIAQNTSAPNLSLSPRQGSVLLDWSNIPDSIPQ
jgi:hypothetical protein